MTTPPPLPIVEFQEICFRATDGKSWAVGFDEDSWLVFTSSEKSRERVPVTYRGKVVDVIVMSRPKILKGG